MPYCTKERAAPSASGCTASPPSQAAQPVHLHRLHSQSTFTGCTASPPSQAARPVHLHRLHGQSTFTGCTASPPSQAARPVHLHRLHGQSTFTGCTASPPSQAVRPVHIRRMRICMRNFLLLLARPHMVCRFPCHPRSFDEASTRSCWRKKAEVRLGGVSLRGNYISGGFQWHTVNKALARVRFHAADAMEPRPVLVLGSRLVICGCRWH